MWPLDSNAHECSPPAVTWVASDTPCTSTGVLLFVVVPSPSCPDSFLPQQSMWPFDSNAHELSLVAVT